MMNRSVLVAIAIALVAVLWIVSGKFGGGDDPQAAVSSTASASGENGVSQGEAGVATQPPKRVRVMDSVAQPMRATLNLYGQTKAPQDVTLRAEVSGPLISLSVQKGDVVRKGQELMRLGAKDRPARLAEAKARVAQMSLKYQQAAKLARNDFASRTTVAEAKANLENAQASLALIEQEIHDTVITAPFAGVFDENAVEVGDTISVGLELGRLVRLDPMTVIAEVSERNLQQIDRHGEAEVTLVGGHSFHGRVSWVAQVASEQTRTYRVEVEIPNPENAIPAGMTASVALPLQSVKAHLVSPAMLTLDDQGRVGIKAVNDSNRVVFYEVIPVEDSQGGMWLSGLPDHLRMITVGQDYVTVGGLADPVLQDKPLVPLGTDQQVQDVNSAGQADTGNGGAANGGAGQ